MKFGLANIFPYRLHFSNSIYISQLLGSNNEVHYMVCDGCLAKCHYKLTNSHLSDEMACLKCSLGSFKSLKLGRNESISYLSHYNNSNGEINNYLSNERVEEWGYSSIATAYRLETYESVRQKKNLLSEQGESLRRVYYSTINWIKEKELDLLIVFNGRMDVTRAIIEACRDLNIRFITHETPWFGDGINLIENEICIDLNAWKLLGQNYKRQLSVSELDLAKAVIFRRLSGESHSEWRQYHLKEGELDEVWRRKDSKRVLILPSSRSEFIGIEQFKTEWSDDLVGFTQVLDELKRLYGDIEIVIKPHPIWEEKVFGKIALEANEIYERYSNENGIRFLGDGFKRSSNRLIAESDIVLLNGSSAALEAGVLGKKIISIAPNLYSSYGFTINMFNSSAIHILKSDLNTFKKEMVIERTLRFVYILKYVFPTFVGDIKSKSNVENLYNWPSKNELAKFNKVLGFKKPSLRSDSFRKIRFKPALKKKKLYLFIDWIRKFFPKGDEL